MSRYDTLQLGSPVACPGCDGGPCRMAWVLKGSGYANDPFGATAALVRAHAPVTTARERDAARAYAATRERRLRDLIPCRAGYGVTTRGEPCPPLTEIPVSFMRDAGASTQRARGRRRA